MVCFPLHAIAMTRANLPLSVIELICKRFPIARSVRVNGKLPYDFFKEANQDHPEFTEVIEVLGGTINMDKHPIALRENDHEVAFNLVRTSPISIKALHRIIKRNPAVAYYTFIP